MPTNKNYTGEIKSHNSILNWKHISPEFELKAKIEHEVFMYPVQFLI